MPENAGSDDILLQGLANLLRAQANLRVSPTIARGLAGREVANAVALVGNWVGGRFFLMPDRLVFQANAMNQRFQSDGGGVVIELSQVRTIATGRMLRFLKTLDISTTDAVFRLRTGRRKRIALEAGLRRLCTYIQPD